MTNGYRAKGRGAHSATHAGPGANVGKGGNATGAETPNKCQQERTGNCHAPPGHRTVCFQLRYCGLYLSKRNNPRSNPGGLIIFGEHTTKPKHTRREGQQQLRSVEAHYHQRNKMTEVLLR